MTAGPGQFEVAFITDITERKRSERELRESEQRFRNLVETSSDWVWEVDTEGVFTWVSPQVRDVLGYQPEELVGRSVFDLPDPVSPGHGQALPLQLKGKLEPQGFVLVFSDRCLAAQGQGLNRAFGRHPVQVAVGLQ